MQTRPFRRPLTYQQVHCKLSKTEFLVSRAGATRLGIAGVMLLATVALAQTSPPPAPRGVLAPAPETSTASKSLPDAPYVPLTNRQKFNIFARQTHAPYTFISAAMDATYAQMAGDPYEYGGGMAGWGKRYGVALAGMESSRFFGNFLFPTMFHQDPRYFPAKPNTGFIGRGWHAATRVLITRHDNGRSEFNYSEVFSNLFTVSLANAYYPERERGFGDTLNRFAGDLLSDAGTNLTREFWPDIKRLFRRHEPKRLQDIQNKIENRIPGSLRGADQQ